MIPSLFLSLPNDFKRSNRNSTCLDNQQLKESNQKIESSCLLLQFVKFRWNLHGYFVLRCFKRLDRLKKDYTANVCTQRALTAARGFVRSPSAGCGDSGIGGGSRLGRQDVPPGLSHVRLPSRRQHHLVDRQQTAPGRLTGGENDRSTAALNCSAAGSYNRP